MSWLLPLVTLAFAGFSLVLSSFFAFRSLSRSASAEYVDQLEKRITECEADRKSLRNEVHQLRGEVNLLRENEHRLLTRLMEREEERRQ